MFNREDATNYAKNAKLYFQFLASSAEASAKAGLLPAAK